MGGIATDPQHGYGTNPMGEVDGVPGQQHGGSKLAAASRRDGTARCTAYTGEHSVYAQHAAPRSEGCVAMQLPDHTRPQDEEPRHGDITPTQDLRWTDQTDRGDGQDADTTDLPTTP